jgi:hypothetical protein
MTTFKLSKKDVGVSLTTFHVYNSAGDIIGSINVPNEDAGDLQRHWCGGTTQQAMAAASSKRNAVADAMRKRSGAAALGASGTSKRNPMISALVKAPRHRMTYAAILRSC